MKKSDIAIYVSAILTLVLTTFVVFSTQKVTYENKIDEILSTKNKQTDGIIVKKDDNTVSPLFKTKIDKADDSTLKTSVAIVDKKTDSDSSKVNLKKSFADLNDFNKKPVRKINTNVTKKQSTLKTRSFFKAASVKKRTIKRRKSSTKRIAMKKRTTISHTSGSRIYTVRNGDTMWKIAQRHNTSTMSLIRKNALRNPNLIYPGMKIKV